MAMESSYTSRLIDLILEMASLFLSRRQNAPSSLPPAAMPVHRKTYDTPRAPVLPPEPEPKLRPEQVSKYDIVPAPPPTPAPAEQRSGDWDVDWGGSRSGVAEVKDSKEDDNGDMLVDQVIGADAVTAFVRLFSVTSLSSDVLSLLSSATELLEASSSSSPSATGIPCTPSANSNSVSTSLPLLPLALSSSFICAPQVVPHLVLQVTRAGIPLPDDVPCFERLCSRTVGRPVKDMIREELDQEEGIIARIQYFLGENDNIFRAKDRKQRNCIFQAIHNGKFEVVLDDFIDSSPSTYRTLSSTAVSPAHPCASTRILFLYRTVAAFDPFALTMKRGDKVRDAARQAVASVGLKMVVGHQRRFAEDLRSAPTLSLLPMARCTSEGNGAARFTKLVKMMLSGLRADERNIGRIWSSRRRMGAVQGKGKGKAGRMKTTRKMAKS
ncbi:hypothetical protein EDB86DRAFT_3137780 [Lactarius hatsudake]|nr:hypothetical protein EDB86DRAFT_3137780 [Lactarius hatsudake]